MRYLHKLVKGHRRPDGTFGYLVRINGVMEFYRLAWMAQARAEGWQPPFEPVVVSGEEVSR